jgi:hypothetical protein
MSGYDFNFLNTDGIQQKKYDYKNFHFSNIIWPKIGLGVFRQK